MNELELCKWVVYEVQNGSVIIADLPDKIFQKVVWVSNSTRLGTIEGYFN